MTYQDFKGVTLPYLAALVLDVRTPMSIRLGAFETMAARVSELPKVYMDFSKDEQAEIKAAYAIDAGEMAKAGFIAAKAEAEMSRCEMKAEVERLDGTAGNLCADITDGMIAARTEIITNAQAAIARAKEADAEMASIASLNIAAEEMEKAERMVERKAAMAAESDAIGARRAKAASDIAHMAKVEATAKIEAANLLGRQCAAISKKADQATAALFEFRAKYETAVEKAEAADAKMRALYTDVERLDAAE